MEASAVLCFSVPELCVAKFALDNESDGTLPILMLCHTAEQCDFINANIIAGNEVMAHLNIDEQGAISIFLEINCPDGFIITADDCQIIQQISGADHPPMVPLNCLLTTVIIGADYFTDPELCRTLMENRKSTGYFSVSFGYRPNGGTQAFSSEDAYFIKFKNFTALPAEKFIEQMST